MEGGSGKQVGGENLCYVTSDKIWIFHQKATLQDFQASLFVHC